MQFSCLIRSSSVFRLSSSIFLSLRIPHLINRSPGVETEEEVEEELLLFVEFRSECKNEEREESGTSLAPSLYRVGLRLFPAERALAAFLGLTDELGRGD